MDNFGFIIARHVNSETTNKYWNQAVRCIRKHYPYKKIVIIDDNSNQSLVSSDYDYQNIEVIQSEYHGRGELLPYYYFHKHHFFENAVIIHDSIFFHKRIHFEKFCGFRVVPLWHFNADTENFVNSIRIASSMKNNVNIKRHLVAPNDLNVLGMSKIEWHGCFGVQSFINYSFLNYLQNKYGIFRMLEKVRTRADRCCLERIMGVLFCTESPDCVKLQSLFGPIFTYIRWGYTFDEYMEDGEKGVVQKSVIKVWTGR